MAHPVTFHVGQKVIWATDAFCIPSWQFDWCRSTYGNGPFTVHAVRSSPDIQAVGHIQQIQIEEIVDHDDDGRGWFSGAYFAPLTH